VSGFCAEGGREERQRNRGREGGRRDRGTEGGRNRERGRRLFGVLLLESFVASILYLKPEKLLLKHQFILQEGRRVQRVCGMKCLSEGSVTHNFHEGS